VRIVKAYLEHTDWSEDSLARFAMKIKPLLDQFEES